MTGVVAWAPPVAWAAILLWLGSRPLGTAGPAGIDKPGHVLAYGILGLLAARAWRAAGLRPHAAVVVTLAVTVGLVDELNQMRVPARTADPFDLLADAIGVVVGFVLIQRLASHTERTAETE